MKENNKEYEMSILLDEDNKKDINKSKSLIDSDINDISNLPPVSKIKKNKTSAQGKKVLGINRTRSCLTREVPKIIEDSFDIDAREAIFNSKSYNKDVIGDLMTKQEFERKVYRLNELALKACKEANSEKSKIIYTSTWVLFIFTFLSALLCCFFVYIDEIVLSILFSVTTIGLIALNLVIISKKEIRTINDFDYLVNKYITAELNKYSDDEINWVYDRKSGKVIVTRLKR